MNEHLLIVGAGLMQLPVIDLAKKNAISTVCLDGNPDAPGREKADFFYRVDIKDESACLKAAKAHRARHRLDGVITVGTDFSTTVAWIAEHLSLPGLPYRTVLLAKDKGRMRARFAEKNVPSPRFEIRSGADDLARPPVFGFPAVVKPVDNMGARGVRRVDDPDGWRQAAQEALSFSSSARIIVEQYIDGPEFSLDAIVRSGEVRITGFADRHIFFPPHFVELGHSFPSAFSSEVVSAVSRAFIEGIQALGLTEGAAKGDVKLGPEGPVIGEIAARLSGGFMSGWTYPLSSGRSSILWAVETALGRPLSEQGPDLGRPVVERAFFSIPGELASIEGIAQARAVPGVEEFFTLAKAGDQVVFPRNNVEKCGNLLVTGATRAEAEARADEARSRLLLRLKPRCPATEAFLRADDQPWIFPDKTGSANHAMDVFGVSLTRRLEQLRAIFPGLDPETPFVREALLKGGLQGAVYAAETQGGQRWTGLPPNW